MTKYPCIECKKDVTGKNGGGLQCSICARWQHKSCGIPESTYQLAVDMKENRGSHIWTCEGCGTGLSNLQKMIQMQDTKIRTVELDVEKVKTRVTTNEGSIAENSGRITKVEEDFKEIKKNVSSKPEEVLIKEMDAREEKKCNIIIHGIEESDSESIKDRKQDDEEAVLELFDFLGEEIDSKNDIKFITRIGEKSKNMDSHRPMLLGFRRLESREKILGKGWKLARSIYKHISISPDLTKRQREKDKNQWKECEKLNKELSEDDKAKNLEWRPIGAPGLRRPAKLPAREGQENRTKKRVERVGRSRLLSQKRRRSPSSKDDSENSEVEEPDRAKSKTKTPRQS